MWVMKSRLMDTPLIRDVIMGIIRSTFYEHFCAGENAMAAGRSVLELNEAGLRGMLVYALEYAGDNDACDRNLQGFLDTAEATKSLPPSSVSSSHHQSIQKSCLQDLFFFIFVFVFVFYHLKNSNGKFPVEGFLLFLTFN